MSRPARTLSVLVCLLLTATALVADVLRVRQDGSGDFDDVRSAVRASRAGDVIEVGDGYYIGPGMSLDKDRVRLIAERPGGAIIAAPLMVLSISGDDVVLQGLRIHANGEGRILIPAVVIEGANNTQILDNVIRGADVAIELVEAEAPQIHRNDLSQNIFGLALINTDTPVLAQDNWWGSVDPSEAARRVRGDASRVEFQPLAPVFEDGGTRQ